MMSPMRAPMLMPQVAQPAPMPPYGMMPQMMPQPMMIPQTMCGYGLPCPPPCAVPCAHHSHKPKKLNPQKMVQGKNGLHIHYHPVKGAPDYMGPIMSIAMLFNKVMTQGK